MFPQFEPYVWHVHASIALHCKPHYRSWQGLMMFLFVVNIAGCPVGQDDRDIVQAVELELQQRQARVQALQPDAAMQDGDQAMEAEEDSPALVVCPLPSQAVWGHAAISLLEVTSTFTSAFGSVGRQECYLLYIACSLFVTAKDCFCIVMNLPVGKLCSCASRPQRLWLTGYAGCSGGCLII